jgi:DNA-binding GntR family transcriptional regulator
VQSSPQRGFWVTPLSIKDLRDLTRARVLIETLALRESIASGAPTWESTVLTSHHTLDKTPMITADGHVNPHWESAHRDFHHARLSGCGCARLESIATELRDCAELYRFWSRELAHDTDRDVASEHRRLTELMASPHY